jgi:hypothetical protein
MWGWNRLFHVLWVDVHPSHAGFFPNLVGLATWVSAVIIVVLGIVISVFLFIL